MFVRTFSPFVSGWLAKFHNCVPLEPLAIQIAESCLKEAYTPQDGKTNSFQFAFKDGRNLDVSAKDLFMDKLLNGKKNQNQGKSPRDRFW